MKYEQEVSNILYELGVRKMYKGCQYILTGIYFISQNENNFCPVTKILYVEIAKKHDTSNLCVEKNIRSVIEHIWKQHKNDALMYKIFGTHSHTKRPSNIEFLTLLYDYVKNTASLPLPEDKWKTFTCPLSGNECEFCTEFIVNFLKEYGGNYEEK